MHLSSLASCRKLRSQGGKTTQFPVTIQTKKNFLIYIENNVTFHFGLYLGSRLYIGQFDFQRGGWKKTSKDPFFFFGLFLFLFLFFFSPLFLPSRFLHVRRMAKREERCHSPDPYWRDGGRAGGPHGPPSHTPTYI